MDVTIMPWTNHLSVLSAWMSIIKNPTREEFDACVHAALGVTMPFLSRIRAHCSVEMTLDRCVQRLRRRIAQGGWDRRQSQHEANAPTDQLQEGGGEESSRLVFKMVVVCTRLGQNHKMRLVLFARTVC